MMMRIVFVGWALMAMLTGVLGCGDEASPVDPCHGVTCSGQGSCAEQDGQAVCQCNEGYRPEGLDCVEDLCTGVPWVRNAEAANAPLNDGALVLSAAGEEMPSISYSITGNFDVSFLVEELSGNAQVRFTASAGNRVDHRRHGAGEGHRRLGQPGQHQRER